MKFAKVWRKRSGQALGRHAGGRRWTIAKTEKPAATPEVIRTMNIDVLCGISYAAKEYR
jgi:hypothetical protein